MEIRPRSDQYIPVYRTVALPQPLIVSRPLTFLRYTLLGPTGDAAILFESCQLMPIAGRTEG